MRKAVACLLVVVAAACSDSTGAGGRSGADFVGQWTLSVAETSCWPAFTVRFQIDAEDGERASSEFINVVSVWGFPSDNEQGRMLSGNINWHRDDFLLKFWKLPGLYADFSGYGPSPDQLVGTFYDASDTFRTRFGAVRCTGDAAATKD